MVGNGDKNFCDIYEQWKMEKVVQQQKEYYDSLEKKSKSEKSEVDLLADMFEELNSIAEEEIEKAFEKGLNDYYNDLLKQKTPTQTTAEINEGHLREEDIKRATKRKLDAIKKEGEKPRANQLDFAERVKANGFNWHYFDNEESFWNVFSV